MLTWLILGISAQIAWTVYYLFILKECTIKEYIDALTEFGILGGVMTLGVVAVNVVLWPIAVYYDVKFILGTEKNRES